MTLRLQGVDPGPSDSSFVLVYDDEHRTDYGSDWHEHKLNVRDCTWDELHPQCVHEQLGLRLVREAE